MAGYSGTPLLRKLGIKPAMRMRCINPPDTYFDDLGPLPDDVLLVKRTQGTFNFIHLFSDSAADLHRRLPTLKRALREDGGLWISWPKKSSGVETDLSGDIVREAGLGAGLVDIKVCAVDEIWSGLKFVYRTADR